MSGRILHGKKIVSLLLYRYHYHDEIIHDSSKSNGISVSCNRNGMRSSRTTETETKLLLC